MLNTFLVAWLLWSQQSTAPAAPEPLPPLDSFLREFRQTLHSDRYLLSQYTYTEKQTTEELDGKDRVKKTTVEVTEVFPGQEPWQTYRRVVSRNGKPVTTEEAAKQERESRQRIDKEGARRSGDPEKYARRQEKNRREEEQAIDDAFRLFDIQVLGRDSLDGHPAILVSFTPRPEYKPREREIRMLKNVAGRAWVSETDHQLMRIEASAMNTITVGGILARIQKGTRIVVERRRINGEVWLPHRVEFSGAARILLVKGFHLRSTSEYYDHRRFSTETILNFGTEKKP